MQKIIFIDHEPDYDLIKIQRSQDNDYYFRHSYSFHGEFDAVIKAALVNTQVQAESVIYDLCKQLKIPYDPLKLTNVVQQIHTHDKNILSEHAFEIDMDQFKLHQLRVQGIDNTNRKVFYEGSFFGNHHTDMELKLFANLEIEGIAWELQYDDFYRSLLAESYILFTEEKYRLAYFTAYAAFESFINQYCPSTKVKDPIIDKLPRLFKSKLGDLNHLQVYADTNNIFKTFTADRNNIAHGNMNVHVDKQIAGKMLVYVLTMICAYQASIKTFAEIARLVKVPKQRR